MSNTPRFTANSYYGSYNRNRAVAVEAKIYHNNAVKPKVHAVWSKRNVGKPLPLIQRTFLSTVDNT